MLNLCNMIKDISGYNARIGAPSRKKFDAESSFFTSGAATMAGLILQFMGEKANSCTEAAEEVIPDDAPNLEELFTEKLVKEDIPEKKSRAPRESAASKEAKRKPWKDLGSLLFGQDDDDENQI